MVDEVLILRFESTVCDGIVGGAKSARSLVFCAAIFLRIMFVMGFFMPSLKAEFGAIIFNEDPNALFECDGGGFVVEIAPIVTGLAYCRKRNML